MNLPRLLLLNPPGTRIYIRDYYCSKVSKARYIYHPVDLLILSGRFTGRYQVHLLDCMVDNLTPAEALPRIAALQPEVVVALTGAVSWHEDLEFFRAVKQRTGAFIAVSGDILLEGAAERLEREPAIDAAVLDFTGPDLARYLEGERSGLENLVYREGGRVTAAPVRRARGELFELPLPRQEIFPHARYRYPFVRRHPFATVLTDYGCPFGCSFCVIGRVGFKLRHLEGVQEELRLVRSLGIRDLYIDDQSFGAVRPRTVELLEWMIREKLGMGWICFSRVDLLEPELLGLMRRAGCHTIAIGVESASPEVLSGSGKGLDPGQVEDAVRRCRKLGVRTVGTFVLGLPGDTRASILATIDFAIRLKLDFASFNVPVPRPGTRLRAQALEAGWVDPLTTAMDQSGSFAVMGNENLTADEVFELRNLAARRFYLRPAWALQRLASIRTWHELRSHVAEGLGLLAGLEKRH